MVAKLTPYMTFEMNVVPTNVNFQLRDMVRGCLMQAAPRDQHCRLVSDLERHLQATRHNNK